MQMTVAEIKRNYNEAKDKQRQIGILADLNCCSREEIEMILGEEVKRKTTVPKEVVQEEVKDPNLREVRAVLYSKLESIENQIKSLEEEYRKITIAIEVLEKVEN